MYYMSFEAEGKRLFDIRHKSYPLPRVGDIVTYNTNHYEVIGVRHRFADIQGVTSTGISITMKQRRERELLNQD